MKEAPIPDNDEARLDAFQDYELLVDTPESWFDHIASVASRLCDTPIALVSLVGRDEQFFKASCGLPPGLDSGSRETSFCGHAIFEESILEVPDALEDVRFHDNPWVSGDAGIRFYAGVPLVNNDGYALGTVCVLDERPRCLSEAQRAGLESLAQVVMQHLESRRGETFGRHLNRIINASDNFVAVADARSFQLLHVNQRLRSLIREMGKPAEPGQLSVLDVFPSLDEAFLKDLAGDDPVVSESTDLESIPILNPDQTEYLVRLRIRFSKVRERPVLLLVAEDMSTLLNSLSQAERLSSEVRKLALVARATQNPVIITDAHDSIEWVNPSFEKLTGYQSDDVIGRQPGDFLQGPETEQETRRRLAIAIQQGQPVREEILNYDRFGNRYWLDLDIQPVHDESGALSNYVAVQTDITQLKAQEESFRQARDDAEAANEAKSSLIANVSHELRTPLNGIIGITELLRHDPGRNDVAEQLGILRESADGLLKLINDLLDLSKIEADSMELESRSFRLSDPLRRLEGLLRPLAERKGLELVFTLDESVPCFFRADHHRLCQILTNLLNNAIKFTESGTVRLSVAATPMIGDTVRVVFSISDSGPGIPDSIQEHIFEPFNQADGSTARRHGGTGLGLSICQSLIKLMGGTIELHSSPGEGTSFNVVLPLVKASEDDAEMTEGSDDDSAIPEAAASYRVLLIDDNDVNRRVAEAMLETLGATVVTCENGEQGLSAFEASSFDLVLLDIQMPDLSGYGVVIRMRSMELDRATRTPILAVTAHALSSLEARSDAFDDVVTKPMTFQNLRAALVQWLASGEAIETASPVEKPPLEETEEPQGDALIERELVLRNLNGDPRLVSTLRELFEDQHPHYLDVMDQAVEAGDLASLADASHKLKGAVGYFNQGALWREVADLEKTARAGEEGAVERVAGVREQVLALAEAVRRFQPDQA